LRTSLSCIKLKKRPLKNAAAEVILGKEQWHVKAAPLYLDKTQTVRLIWLNAYSRPLFSVGDFDPEGKSDWPSFWCVIRVHW